jgi:hypothetical protein
MIDLIAVDRTYRHVPKIASPGALLRVGGSRLKWYDVARADTPVPDDVREAARGFLVSEQRTLELDRDVGFAVLHRCAAGNDFYFLPVCTWRNANEMWESVYFKDAKSEGFAPFVQSGRHRGTLCVWELGPVIHEQRAWVRFLQSPRAEADLNVYLESTYEGEVGGASDTATSSPTP